MKGLLVFDCDGVMRSWSWRGIFLAYVKIFEFLKVNYLDYFNNEETFKKWFDHNWKNNFKECSSRLEENMEMVNKIFHEIYDPYVQTFDWLDSILERLSLENEIAVLSSSLTSSIVGSIGDAKRHISLIIGCDLVKNPKPDPEGLQLIMKELGYSPEMTWMIGDTKVDADAAREAGTWIALVNWGFTEGKNELISFEPHIILEDPNDPFIL